MYTSLDDMMEYQAEHILDNNCDVYVLVPVPRWMVAWMIEEYLNRAKEENNESE